MAIATGSVSSHAPYVPRGASRARCPKKPGGNRLVKSASAPPLASQSFFALLAQLRGLVGRVGGVLGRHDVAQVAEQVHRFVIAEHDVQLAARRACLALQAHQQVHDLARIAAAIEQIAEAHDVRGAGGPVVGSVDHAGLAQQRHELVVGAVHVCERDHAWDIAPHRARCVGSRRLAVRRGREQGRQQDCRHLDRPLQFAMMDLANVQRTVKTS